MNQKKTIKLEGGKYTIVYDKTNQYPEKCLRYGEEWRDLIGDKLIFALCNEIEELERDNEDLYEKARQSYQKGFCDAGNYKNNFKEYNI